MQEQCNDFRFEVGGVFQRESDVAWWPLEAAGPVELEDRLAQGGHLLPLPREPAALANVLEVSVVNFLALRVLGVCGSPDTPWHRTGLSRLRDHGASFRRWIPRCRDKGGPAGAERQTDAEQDHAVYRQHILQVAQLALAGNLPAVQ